ncbi:DBH-like monooxygenase protein 1 homolog [Halichondria panicea]|uniref:DBH-like monooxygenase protein 1 homolog n=1 Tax=Halichondria panicea TaxID=6063 RepID=UPI00312B3D40
MVYISEIGIMKCVFFLALLLPAVLAANIDLSTYPLTADLRPGSYRLHWSFNVEEQSIRFAVNVSTTGWIGLGLSPTGGMPNSDIVIGWVNDQGQAFLDDRFATAQSLPPVDKQQDWILEAGEQENGFTVLAFRRNWTTCDQQDRDINTDTARIIFSWNDVDPVSDDPTSATYHGRQNRGTLSINLLGGQQQVPPDSDDLQTFDVAVNAVAVPSESTTYWCYVEEFPQDIRAMTHYVTKISPVITPGNELHVHHILIYECENLNATHVGFSAPCNGGGPTGIMVSQCRQGTLIVGWAVGGGDFVFPADVAYPVGGGGPRYLVMETHYDNPNQASNIVDNSGMRFSYTATPRTYDSGILQVGQTVNRQMIIPPGASQFKLFGECSSGCTNTNIPSTGINVFANTLHTHLAGFALILHHLRPDSSCGNGYRELEPIDQNLRYDFNFQQANYLTRVVNVQPGDIIRLECQYSTEGRAGVSVGGESTTEEMCLSFLNYYPRNDLTACLTNIPLVQNVYQPFLTNHVTAQQINAILTARSDAEYLNALNVIPWSPEAVESFQSSIINGPFRDSCFTVQDTSSEIFSNGLQEADAQCQYQANDPCNPGGNPGGNSASVIVASISITIMVSVMALFM